MTLDSALIALPSLHLQLLYLPAVLLCIASPGPDMLLSIARGLGQGKLAAWVSATGTTCGIACHSLLVGLGLTALLQASVAAFTVLKLAGAAYLVWLGVQAIRSHSLITLDAAKQLPLPRVFLAGWMSNLLNPKVAVFVLAFIPQFVDPAAAASVARAQIFGLGAVFAGLTLLSYGGMGSAASGIRRVLLARPHWVRRLNVGAGTVLVASGLGVLALRQR